MKKNTIKAFTLVEMLIVIVIIGILIASLMPRMQSAQGRARDVARKNDLAQIQTAIITSQQDRGEFPGMTGTNVTLNQARSGMGISTIGDELLRAGMSSIPEDPNKSNKVTGLGYYDSSKPLSGGDYGYMVSTRNGIEDGGFILMAKTEVEGGSNWIYCGTSTLSGDLKDVQTCTSFVLDESDEAQCKNENGVCTYTGVDQLRYILLY